MQNIPFIEALQENSEIKNHNPNMIDNIYEHGFIFAGDHEGKTLKFSWKIK